MNVSGDFTEFDGGDSCRFRQLSTSAMGNQGFFQRIYTHPFKEQTKIAIIISNNNNIIWNNKYNFTDTLNNGRSRWNALRIGC